MSRPRGLLPALRLAFVPATALLGLVFVTPILAHAGAEAPSPAGIRSIPAPTTIAIDAGHGGSPNNNNPSQLYDPGTMVPGLTEKDITLKLALALRQLLQRDGVRVIMTRTDDRYLELSQRQRIASKGGAQAFVSIHVNAFDGDAGVNGMTVFYNRDSSLPLADAVHSALGRRLDAYRTNDDGTAILDGLWMKNTMPTVTVEPAYLTNPSDAQLLGEQHFLDAIDTGLRDGLRHYFPAIAARNQAIQANQRLAAQLASARLAAALQGARFRAGIALLALAALILLRRPGAWVGRRAGGALAGSVEQLVYPPSRRAHRRQRQLRRASLAASDYNAGHRHYARARR